jgi:hypothetical protein
MRPVRFTALVIAFLFAMTAMAQAATYNPKKLKKWPEEDRIWARAFSAWMSQEEMDVFVKLDSTDERKDFLDKAGYWRIWTEVDRGKLDGDPKMMPHVMAGEVIVGMTKDEVFLCWGKPKKIRKDFRKDAYVDVLNYEFERDRKGVEFVLLADSQTAYKNEVFTRFVYMFNGHVFSIVNEGEEENVMDDLPVDDKAEVEERKERVGDDDDSAGAEGGEAEEAATD